MSEQDPNFFDRLWKKNPLLGLSYYDRLELSDLLSEAGALMRSKRLRERKQKFDGDHLVAEQCFALASALRQEIFSKPHWREQKFLKFSAVLPSMLENLGRSIQRRADLLIKKGQAHKDIPRRYLIEASEFVRMKTGHYNDHDFAELAKFYLPKTNQGSDVSGDWIADRRKEFRSAYPDYFLYIQTTLRERIEEEEREDERQLLDSLDLSNNPIVIQAWQDLARKYGAGSSDAELSSEEESNPDMNQPQR